MRARCNRLDEKENMTVGDPKGQREAVETREGRTDFKSGGERKATER